MKQSRSYNYLVLAVLLLVQCSATPSSTIDTTSTDSEKQVTCFVYHRVNDSRYPSTNVSAKDFEDHLSWLTSQNYRMVTFSEAVKYLKSDEPARKTAVITIDDGYKSFFKNGLPLLKKYKVPATIFINTKTVGAGDYMSWSDLKSCIGSNVEIGNHTHSHDFFLNQPEATRYQTFRDEIKLSQKLIADALGVKPIIFSYPYGEFDPKMKQIAQDEGFLAAAAQNSGVLHSRSDFFQCPRFPMSEAYSSKKQFVEKAKMKALRVLETMPASYMITPDGRPELTLLLQNTDLNTTQLKCFVQGGASTVKFAGENKVIVRATSSIAKRRRTLYTITVPDKNGVWYWYSHLWINPEMEDK